MAKKRQLNTIKEVAVEVSVRYTDEDNQLRLYELVQLVIDEHKVPKSIQTSNVISYLAGVGARVLAPTIQIEDNAAKEGLKEAKRLQDAGHLKTATPTGDIDAGTHAAEAMLASGELS